MSLTARICAAASVALLLPVLIAAAAGGAISAILANSTSTPSQSARADIPADYLILYQRAATGCPGLDWAVLAAIGKIESDHGRSTLPGVSSGQNAAGAGGPMQILRPTWDGILARHQIPPGGATPPSRYNPSDAVHAAAFYLCDNGARAGRDLRGAIFAYNHANWYVQQVLTQAAQYRAAPATTPDTGPAIGPAARPDAEAWAVPADGRCTSGFGPRGGELHRGQDIAAPIGTPILAARSGTVIASGPASGYGLWVRIQHAGSITTTYGHNNRNLVTTGQTVTTGQPIAEVGNRGQSTGPHLHFQVEPDGQPVDPRAFYRQRGAPPLCRSE